MTTADFQQTFRAAFDEGFLVAQGRYGARPGERFYDVDAAWEQSDAKEALHEILSPDTLKAENPVWPLWRVKP